jgi:hypothetical protein
MLRFGRIGSLLDIEDAISCLLKAVELIPDGHPRKPGGPSALGNALRKHAIRFNSLIDTRRPCVWVTRLVGICCKTWSK